MPRPDHVGTPCTVVVPNIMNVNSDVTLKARPRYSSAPSRDHGTKAIFIVKGTPHYSLRNITLLCATRWTGGHLVCVFMVTSRVLWALLRPSEILGNDSHGATSATRVMSPPHQERPVRHELAFGSEVGDGVACTCNGALWITHMASATTASQDKTTLLPLSH